MTDLIERIEGAGEGSRELDCRIWAALEGGGFDTYRAVVPDFNQWQAPAYTTDLNAAMSLVPEGYHTALAMQDRHSLRWNWELRGGYGFRHAARAQTAALALCAAALKSRTTADGGGE